MLRSLILNHFSRTFSYKFSDQRCIKSLGIHSSLSFEDRCEEEKCQNHLLITASSPARFHWQYISRKHSDLELLFLHRLEVINPCFIVRNHISQFSSAVFIMRIYAYSVTTFIIRMTVEWGKKPHIRGTKRLRGVLPQHFLNDLKL